MATDRVALTEELVLRLVHVQAMLSSVKTDEDTGELLEDADGLLSALDYALRGDRGCSEPEDVEEERRRALARWGEYLGLGVPV